MTSDRKPINELLSSTPRRALALFAAVGTITGAVAGVIALLPKSAPPPDALSASFGDVKAYPNMSIEQYDARASQGIVGTSHTASTGSGSATITYELAADTSAGSSSSASEAGETEESSGSSSGTTSGSGSEGETGPSQDKSTDTEGTTPTTPTTEHEERASEGEGDEEQDAKHTGGKTQPKSPDLPPKDEQSSPQGTTEPDPESLLHTKGAAFAIGSGMPDGQVEETLEQMEAGEAELPQTGEGSEDQETEAAALAPNVMRNCKEHRACGARQEIEAALTSDPDPAKAAHAVLRMFKDSRSEIFEQELHPIGVMISYNVSLAGFAHESAKLVWTLMGQADRRPPPRPWWQNIVVAYIKPQVNNESLAGNFWVPIPRRHGSYVVHLVLLDSHGTAHDSSDSAPVFH